MLAKRLHSNTKSGVLNRSTASKEVLSKTTTARYKQGTDSCDVEINVTFPYLRPSENAELLPGYTSVLSRTADVGIGMKDLDQLQQELEKLLSTCAVRNRLLSSEFELIDRVEERHEKKRKLFDKPPSPKHRKIEDKPKHVKDTKPAYKLVKNFHDELPKVEVPEIIFPKNDTKSKFWLSVDTFCAPVSKDDVAYLDELIQECRKEIDFKIPELGPHYVEEWRRNDTDQVAPVVSRPGKNKIATSNTDNFNNKKTGYLFCVNTGEPFQNSVILPLTSALLEENVINKIPTNADMKDIASKPMNNTNMCLDKRLRHELVELGILEPDDDPKSALPVDELAQEIRMCQEELCNVNEQNKRELNRLRNLVNKDISRQDLLHKLDEVDNKVMEIYNKLLVSNPKENNNLEWEAVRILQMQRDLHKKAMEMTDDLM